MQSDHTCLPFETAVKDGRKLAMVQICIKLPIVDLMQGQKIISGHGFVSGT